MFSILSEAPLTVSGSETYRSAAFDGCQYYFTVRCRREIAVFDRNLCFVKTIETGRIYTAITFDSERCVFWANSDECPMTVFKLDCCFNEIDCITVRCKGCFGKITDLSFCCKSGLLLISCGNRILKFNPQNNATRTLIEEKDGGLILAVLCIPPFVLYYVVRGGKAFFVLADSEGRFISEKKAEGLPVISAMLSDPCKAQKGGHDLLLLGDKRGCYPHLFRVRLSKKISDSLCPCNRELCFEKCCEKKCCEKKCPDKSECNKCEEPCACGDILESIALQEAALAHILNAEGEKLQRAVGESSDIHELLSVNKSVQTTLQNVTQLEKVLVTKLEALGDICCFRDEIERC